MKFKFSYQTITFFVVSFLAAVVLYWPSLHMGFVLDDQYVIVQNPLIKNIQLFPQIFFEGFFGQAHRLAESGLSYYRPFLTLTFALDYQLWGLNAFAMQLTNLGIHLLNAVLVFWFLDKLFKNARWAAFTTLIFLFHPVHEWAIRYLTGRGDVLQGFFTLGMLCAYLQFEFTKKKQWFVISLVSFLSAILVREGALVNFLLIGLVSYFLRREWKQALKITLPFLSIAAGYYLLRKIYFPITQQIDFGYLKSWTYGVKFALHWICPILLQSFWGNSLAAGWVIIVFTALVWGVTQAWRHAREKPILIFAIVWMGISLLPLMVAYRLLDRLGPVISEHFLYLGSIGFGLLLAVIVFQIQNKLWHSGMLSLVLIIFWAVGLCNGFFWKGEEVLLRHAQYVQGNGFTVPDEQLALRYDRDPQKVLDILKLPASPSIKSFWVKHLGHLNREDRKYDTAEALFKTALQFNPQNTEAWDELAVVYFETGRWEEGYRALQSSLTVDPRNSQAFRLLGTSALIQKHFDQAIASLVQAIQLDPDDREAARLLAEAKMKRAQP